MWPMSSKFWPTRSKLEAPNALLVYPRPVETELDFHVSGIHVRGLAFDLGNNILESGKEFTRSLNSFLTTNET